MQKIYILFCDNKVISIHRNEQKAIDKMNYYIANDIELYGRTDDYEIRVNYLEE